MATAEYYVGLGYPLEVAKEKSANDRAGLEGFESAAHKEAYANSLRKAADPNALSAAEYEYESNKRAKNVIDPRTGQGFTSASEMETYANEQSQKVWNPNKGEYFTSAADYEIDANRRARDAGWLNAADLELYGPEGATRMDPLLYPFVDPRTLPAPIIPAEFRSKDYAEERGLTGDANDIRFNPDQPDHPQYDPNWRNDPKWAAIYGDDASANIKGEAGSMDLLSYRPGSQKYWDTYLPKNTGLMDMNLPPPEYSLAYAPGEWLAPKTWRDVIDAPGDQMRDIPQGAWRYATYKPSAYNEAGYPKQGISATTADLNMPGWPTRMPWQFTSPAMRTNIAQQPWSAKQLNISPTQGEAWQGLLTGLGTAPAIDTTSLSLLGVA